MLFDGISENADIIDVDVETPFPCDLKVEIYVYQ